MRKMEDRLSFLVTPPGAAMSRLAQFASLALLGLLFLTGCNQSSTLDAKTLAAYRTQLALAEEPDAIQTVFDIRTTLLGETSHADHDAEHDHEGHDHAEHDHKEHDHDDHHDHAHHTAAVGPIKASVVGHIGGLANPWETTQRDFPFDTTQAVFFLADPQAVIENEASGHSHAPGEECAFCAAHAADNSDKLAMVQLVDQNGKVLAVDVRKLFDIKEKDTVVVSGSARITEGGMMVIQATGMYIRK